MNSGARLQQLRQLKGLNQSAVADLASVSQATVARLERGADVGDTHRDAVRRALHAPEALLDRPVPQRVDVSTTWFRAHSDMRAWERDRAHRWGEIAYEALMHLRSKVRIPQPARLAVDVDDPEKAAAAARDALGIRPDQPIANLVRTLERAGVRVLPLPLDAAVHSAYSMLAGSDDDEPVIFVFRGGHPDRNRFTLAHELGHIAMHGAFPREDRRAAERQADDFAGAFLLPAEPFIADLNDASATLTTFLRLKPRWGVSIAAMIMRGVRLGRITEWQQRNLFTQLSARGWRTDEPVKLRPEVPMQLSKAVQLAYGDPPRLHDLAEDLALPRDVIIRLFGDQAPAVEEPSRVVELDAARRRRRPTSDLEVEEA